MVALELEAIAAVPNLEEDKMKPQPSLLGVGNKGRREEGATLKVWSEKREVDKTKGEEQMTSGTSVTLFQGTIGSFFH